MNSISPKNKPFIWCPNCGIHNYWDDKGDHLECEDCHYALAIPKNEIGFIQAGNTSTSAPSVPYWR